MAASDAKGGAVWLVGSRAQDNKSEFQLCAQADFASSLFGRRVAADGAAQDPDGCGARQERRDLQPHARADAADLSPPEGGLVNNGRPTRSCMCRCCWMARPSACCRSGCSPMCRRRIYPEFITFLNTLTPYVEQHLQSRRLSNLVLETQRLQHLLRFTTDLAGSLETLEVARLTANYGRDLAGCERTSVLQHGRGTAGRSSPSPGRKQWSRRVPW